MSLVFVEGWELYEGTGSPPTAFTTKWGSYNKNWNLSVTTGRHFGYGMSFGKDWTGTADYAITPAQTPKATWIVGLNIQRGASSHNGPFLRAYSGGTIQLEFRINGADIQVYRGGSTLIHTFSSVLSSATDTSWHHLQFKMTANTSTGSVECRYENFDKGTDGTSLNTDQAASGSIDRFMLTGTTTAYRTTSWVVDDFWICNTDGARNNDWLGPLVVEGVYPDANGYQNDWTPVVSDTTLSVSACTSGRFYGSDVYSSNFNNNNEFNPSAGPNGESFQYITMFTWTNFLDAYDEFLSVGTFTLNYSIKVVKTEQMLVTVAAGNVTNPASGAAMQTLFGSKLTQTYTVTNPSLGLNTLDITAAITEWQAQGSLNNTWDLILMFSRTAGDTADNVMYFDKMNNFLPYITFSNATSDNVTAVVNPSTNDYVQAAVVGDIDSYTLGEPSNILGNVRAVVLNWQARKGGPSTDIDVRSFVRSGITNGYGVTKNISVPYPYQSYTDVYELNPESGGVPWAREHISNIEIGVELEG